MTSYANEPRYPTDLFEADGNIKNHRTVRKFGNTIDITGAYSPIVRGGLYRQRTVAAAEYLRVKAGGNAGDTFDGVGAREITVEYIDTLGRKRVEALATAGASASGQTAFKSIRLFRTYVSKSGVYPTMASSSHVAAINVEGVATGDVWATMVLDDIAQSGSQIGMFPIPLGERALLRSLDLTIDASKSADFVLWATADIIGAAAPFKAGAIKKEWFGITGSKRIEFKTPQKFNALSEFGIMVRSADSSAKASVQMEITLIED